MEEGGHIRGVAGRFIRRISSAGALLGLRYLALVIICTLTFSSILGCELATGGMNTDKSRNIRELERAVVDLERKVEEITLQLAKLSEKVKEYEKTASLTDSGLGEETITEEKIAGDEAAVPTAGDETVAKDTAEDTKVDEAKGEDPQALYDTALREILNRNAEKALPLFIDFVGRYPKHELTDNAYYWIGECYYSMKKYGLALENFMIVNQKFPESGKAPDALLKMGYSYVELGDKARAREILADLISKYPDSAAADLARKKINSL